MPEVIGLLKVSPKVGTSAERLGKAQSHIRRDGAAPVDNLGKGLTGYTQSLGGGGDRKIQRFQIVPFKDPAGVRGGPCFLVHLIYHPSVIIHVIYHISVSVLKLKYDAPVAGNSDRPISFKMSFKRMQDRTRISHIADDRRGIQAVQYIRQFLRLARLDAFFRAGVKKLFQAFVFKVLDHGYSVTYRVTLVKSYF